MLLIALSAGYAIPYTDFDAAIHSVFRSAANLRLLNGDLLLTLVAASEADLPQDIRVATPVGFSYENLRVGEKITCRDGFLTFENAVLTIDFAQARRWKCDLPSLQADMTNPAVASAWKTVWQALNERQRPLEAEIIADDLLHIDEAKPDGVSRRAGVAVQGLIAATRHFDPAADSAVQSLIGLGAGLTPSGDDLLVGYLTGLRSATQGKCEREQFVSNLAETVIRFSPGTNDISRTYLYHAAQGQVSSRLEALAASICQAKNPHRLLDITESAMRVGHTSGMDMVTGLLVGLAAWTSPITLQPQSSKANQAVSLRDF